jgi:SAM-dependent methyltransferase
MGLTRLVRRLNWARRGWSGAADRVYHDAVFQASQYDPADSSYPGWVTIRRFSDLASPSLQGAFRAVDLGCGPGEITCALAARHPQCRFIGVDHSTTAIERATSLATRTGLANAEFLVADVESWTPDAPVDVVMFFDSFHHVRAPREMIVRLGRVTDRFFLIEPAGNWYGGWRQEASLDWLAESIFLIRDRLELQLGESASRAPGSAAPGTPPGDPVERRYPLEDFERLFEGYAVDVRGTIAGIERYGSSPASISSLRRDIGELTYRMLVEIEEVMLKHDLDLSAKHWAISVRKGTAGIRRTHRNHLSGQRVEPTLAGPYDASYRLQSAAPSPVARGTEFAVTVSVTNRSWRDWSSHDPHYMFLSSRIVSRRGEVAIADGPRSPFPRVVQQGQECAVYLKVRAPNQSGRFRVLVDGVHEGVAWFSDNGTPPLEFELTVE